MGPMCVREREPTANPEPLTALEIRLLVLIWRGHTDQEIADLLCYSEGTVGQYLVRIFDKLGVHRRFDACRRALTEGYDLHDRKS